MFDYTGTYHQVLLYYTRYQVPGIIPVPGTCTEESSNKYKINFFDDDERMIFHHYFFLLSFFFSFVDFK